MAYRSAPLKATRDPRTVFSNLKAAARATFCYPSQIQQHAHKTKKEYLMNDNAKPALDNFMQAIIQRDPGHPEFHQAVREICESLIPFGLEYPQ
jgi:hypothetical protein